MLPVVTAWMGLSVGAAIMLVGLMLLWRWLIVLSGFAAPEKSPELVLETISASHFVEKVRWSMDRLGVDYTEHPSAGTLGALYCGRTVPQLKIRTGAVRSVIGNSPEILRYIWGRYGTEDPAAAAFLEPTAERTELESKLDRHGVNLQVWVYYRLLDDRELTLHAWGVANPGIPLWQRQLLRILFPVQAAFVRRSFAISDESVARSVGHIEAFLADMNSQLLDGRRSLLGDSTPNYTDYAFAAMVGLWLMPPGYGGGQAESVRIERDRMPAAMRTDVESWEAAFPQVVTFVKSLYSEERHR
jgi:glutathione S-transferase